MSEELIKRINFAMQFNESEVVRSLVDDMQAEIERLGVELTATKSNAQSSVMRLEMRIAQLSKPYVPMTGDEITDVVAQWYEDTKTGGGLTRHIETAAIARYNEQRGVK